jgi:hypothetical protein
MFLSRKSNRRCIARRGVGGFFAAPKALYRQITQEIGWTPIRTTW